MEKTALTLSRSSAKEGRNPSRVRFRQRSTPSRCAETASCLGLGAFVEIERESGWLPSPRGSDDKVLAPATSTMTTAGFRELIWAIVDRQVILCFCLTKLSWIADDLPRSPCLTSTSPRRA
jgi:hypothetical protein